MDIYIYRSNSADGVCRHFETQQLHHKAGDGERVGMVQDGGVRGPPGGDLRGGAAAEP